MTPRSRHRHADDNETPDIGVALEETLRRYGIAGYVLGMQADANEITVEVAAMDENRLPLFHAEDEALATVKWTASIRDGAGRKNLK